MYIYIKKMYAIKFTESNADKQPVTLDFNTKEGFFDYVKNKRFRAVIDYHRTITCFGKTEKEQISALKKIVSYGINICICSYSTKDEYVSNVTNFISNICNKNISGVVYQVKDTTICFNKFKFELVRLINAKYFIDDDVYNLELDNNVISILFNSKYFPITFSDEIYEKYCKNKDVNYVCHLNFLRAHYIKIKKNVKLIRNIDILLKFLNKQENNRCFIRDTKRYIYNSTRISL